MHPYLWPDSYGQVCDLPWEEYGEIIQKPITSPGVFVFDNPVVEIFSQTAWYEVPMVWLPIVTCMLLAANTLDTAYIALGAVLWMFLEYLLHRYLFHSHLCSPRLHFLLHGLHHILPTDDQRLVFPPLATAIIATPIYLCVYAVFGSTHSLLVMAGILLGYVLYDMIHYAIHHVKDLPRPFSWLRARHMYHHFRDHTANFGISSPLVDLLFATSN